MEVVLNPMTGSKIEYIWGSHPRPWRMSIGEIGHAKIEDGCIKVVFTISLREAMLSDRWDTLNNRVFLEVLDAEGRVVIDNWLKFTDQKVITAKLCLGETNV